MGFFFSICEILCNGQFYCKWILPEKCGVWLFCFVGVFVVGFFWLVCLFIGFFLWLTMTYSIFFTCGSYCGTFPSRRADWGWELPFSWRATHRITLLAYQLSIWRTTRSLPTTGKSRKHTESKAMQEAPEKPAEGATALLLQISRGNILELSLEDITDVHVFRGLVRVFNSILSLAVWILSLLKW